MGMCACVCMRVCRQRCRALFLPLPLSHARNVGVTVVGEEVRGGADSDGEESAIKDEDRWTGKRIEGGRGIGGNKGERARKHPTPGASPLSKYFYETRCRRVSWFISEKGFALCRHGGGGGSGGGG